MDEFFVSWTFFDAKNTKHSASRLAMPKNEQFPLKCIKLFLPVIRERERGSLRVNRKINTTQQGRMSSSLHDISHVLLASAYPQVVTVYNIASLTGWRSRDLLISFWYLTHHFAVKNPKKKTGWLITLKNGEKNGKFMNDASPYSGRWFWKNLFSSSFKRGGGGRYPTNPGWLSHELA